MQETSSSLPLDQCTGVRTSREEMNLKVIGLEPNVVVAFHFLGLWQAAPSLQIRSIPKSTPCASVAAVDDTPPVSVTNC